jgi:hypothetical protein
MSHKVAPTTLLLISYSSTELGAVLGALGHLTATRPLSGRWNGYLRIHPSGTRTSSPLGIDSGMERVQRHLVSRFTISLDHCSSGSVGLRASMKRYVVRYRPTLHTLLTMTASDPVDLRMPRTGRANRQTSILGIRTIYSSLRALTPPSQWYLVLCYTARWFIQGLE